MSYEIKVAETDHGDGFSPEPSVVITAKGTDDVARLVHLLANGVTEQIIVAADTVKKLRRNKSGRTALKLLAEIGGPDFTTHLPGEFDPARATPTVQAKTTDGSTVLVCPHPDCGVAGQIHERNIAVSFDLPLDVQIRDGALVIRWDDECGTSPDWQHSRFVCLACNRKVQLPELAEVSA